MSRALRILLAPNAFKGCLGAWEAAQAMARGARRALPGARLELMPVSDGGDGLMEVLLRRWKGARVRLRVLGPLGRPRNAAYAWFPGRRVAVIEMARASGIAGLDPRSLDPLSATSYGTGQLIRNALERGARTLVVGMGGSATSDGGAGMAAALGARLLGPDGRPLPLGAAPLLRLERVLWDKGRLLPRGARVLAVSDVDNPLLGPRGSARIYGPQKGATPAMVRTLERALSRYARVLRRDLGVSVSSLPGAGAAGGLGAGLAAFLGARLAPGADWVLGALGAGARIRRAGLVVTGEGTLDRQSFFGKAPVALARRAGRGGVPVVFICGQVHPSARPGLTRLQARAWSLRRSGEDARRPMREVRVRLEHAARLAVASWAAALGLLLAPGPAPVRAAIASPGLEEADRLYFHRDQDGNLTRAADLLERLSRAGEDAQALWRLGRCAVRAGERVASKREKLVFFREAEARARRSIALDPGNAEAHFWLGVALGRRGQAQGVLKSLFLVGPFKREMLAALRLDPRHGGAHHALGELYRQLPGFAGGSKRKAVAELEKALELDPGYTAHYPAAAQAYLDAGDKEKARAVLRRIESVTQPRDPAEYPENLAEARSMLRKLEDGAPKPLGGGALRAPKNIHG